MQQQINKQDAKESSQQSRSDALQDEMLVDTMMEEASMFDTDLNASGEAVVEVSQRFGDLCTGAILRKCFYAVVWRFTVRIYK